MVCLPMFTVTLPSYLVDGLDRDYVLEWHATLGAVVQAEGRNRQVILVC